MSKQRPHSLLGARAKNPKTSSNERPRLRGSTPWPLRSAAYRSRRLAAKLGNHEGNGSVPAFEDRGRIYLLSLDARRFDQSLMTLDFFNLSIFSLFCA